MTHLGYVTRCSKSLHKSVALLMPILCYHRPGQLLRFTIGEGGLQLNCGRLTSADLTFVGMANQRRGHADTCSKVACHLFLCSL